MTPFIAALAQHRRALARGSAAADTDAEARALRCALTPFAPAGVVLAPGPDGQCAVCA